MFKHGRLRKLILIHNTKVLVIASWHCAGNDPSRSVQERRIPQRLHEVTSPGNAIGTTAHIVKSDFHSDNLNSATQTWRREQKMDSSQSPKCSKAHKTS